MSQKANPKTIGTFVIGAIVILVLGIGAIGGANFFEPKRRFVAYFTGSANGLQVGAPVTLHGVKIGTVAKIGIDYDVPANKAVIPVYLDFEPGSINILNGDGRHMPDFDSLVKAGLRAHLEMQSFVTGQLYVEITFDPHSQIRLYGFDKTVPEVPTVPSPFDSLRQTITKLPIHELTEAAINALHGINELVASPEARQTLLSVAAASQELQATIAEAHKDLKTIADNANATLLDAQTAIRRVDGELSPTFDQARKTMRLTDSQIETLSKDVRVTLRAADGAFKQAEIALSSVNSLIAQTSPQRDEINQLLLNLTLASRSLRSLLDQVERNPNILITGRK